MKIEIGLQVESKKNGSGVITKIITKSTGYVEVTFDNGSVKKEMAFNLTVNGESVKAKKVTENSGMNNTQKRFHAERMIEAGTFKRTESMVERGVMETLSFEIGAAKVAGLIKTNGSVLSLIGKY